MKDMRKILKRGRVQLLNPNEDGLKEMYKEFKKSSKIISKKWKQLCSEQIPVNPEEEKDETQKLVKRKAATLNPETQDIQRKQKHDETGEDTHKEKKAKKNNKRKADTHKNDTYEDVKGEDDTQKPDTTVKPVHTTFQGHNRYLCPSCDFVTHSIGKAYAYMVERHDAKSLQCKKCLFQKKNPTSLHNHRRLHCPKR